MVRTNAQTSKDRRARDYLAREIARDLDWSCDSRDLVALRLEMRPVLTFSIFRVYQSGRAAQNRADAAYRLLRHPGPLAVRS